MTASVVDYERVGKVARIWHNRPAQRNAESQQLLEEIDRRLSEAIADEDVRAIIIAGRGDHFSAGHDLKEAELKRSAFTVEQRWDFESRYYFEYAMRIRDCPKPTIAQVQGACIAGGFMVANLCDLLIASEDAFFADPVVHTMGAAAVEVLVHPWVVGMRKAKEMLFLGSRLSAEEALRIGLANAVVPSGELDRAALDMAARIAEAPPFGMMLAKRSLNRMADMQGFRSGLEAHFDTHQLSHCTQAFKDAKAKGLSKTIR